MCGCGLEADEGLELEVMQVVSLQSEDGQAVQRSESLAVYPGDVVVAQIEHLCRRTEDQRETEGQVEERHMQQAFLHMPPGRAADPDSPAAPQTVCCCVGRAA